MKPTPLTDAILSQPEASKLTFSQRSDLRAIESDRAELIEALRVCSRGIRGMPSEEDKADARALLSRLGAE